jgi:succinate dehydrogenase/fumarate reductase flavoprotein subunit
MNDVLEVIKEPKKLKKTKKPIESIKEEMVEILDTNLEKVNTIDLAEEISDMVRERSKPEGKWRNTNKDFKEIEKKDLPKKSTAIEKSKGLKIAIEELQGLTKFRKKGKY